MEKRFFVEVLYIAPMEPAVETCFGSGLKSIDEAEKFGDGLLDGTAEVSGYKSKGDGTWINNNSGAVIKIDNNFSVIEKYVKTT